MKTVIRFAAIVVASVSIAFVGINQSDSSPQTSAASMLGSTYYFSTAGDDNNTGLSPSAPKRSLGEATRLMQPGNTILFKRGDAWYNSGYQWNVVNKIGTAASPMVVDAYGAGPAPIIANMERVPDTQWEHVTGNLWRWESLHDGEDIRRAFVEGVPKIKVTTLAELDETDEFYFEYDPAIWPRHLYLRLPSPPTGVEAIRLGDNFIMYIENVSHLSFRNIDFRGGGSWVAIRAKAPTESVAFEDCRLTEFSVYGFSFEPSDDPNAQDAYHARTRLIGNTIDKTLAEGDTTADLLGGDGIQFSDAAEGVLIQGNTIVDHGHTGINLHVLRQGYHGIHNTVVDGNEVYLVNSRYGRGFEVVGPEGGTTNNIVRRNYFHDLTNSSHVGGNGNQVYSNLFVHHFPQTVNTPNPQYHALDFMPWVEAGLELVSHDNLIANNTIYQTDMSGIRVFGEHVGNNVFRNNLIVRWGPSGQGTQSYGLQIHWESPGVQQLVENNGFWNTAPDEPVIEQSNIPYTAAEANAAFGNYNDNLQATPAFINEAGRDFRLMAISPFTDTGQVLAGMDEGFVDFDGRAWDPQSPSIGAFQRPSPTPTPTPTNAPTMVPDCHPGDVHPNANHNNPTACDGDVDIADVQRVSACWQRPISATCPATLDMDGSGTITVHDIVIAAGHWGWRR